MFRTVIRFICAATDILLPRLCVVCGKKLLLDESHICLDCLADLPRTFFWKSRHNPMADRFNALIQEGLDLDASVTPDNMRDCVRSASLQGVEAYASAIALFYYDGDSGYADITRRLKYHGDIDEGRYFGHILGMHTASCPWFADVDLVIPVPLHRKRRWERGYNQAEVIAGEIAASLGVPMNAGMLERVRSTKSQARLDPSQKRLNVKGAFKVREQGSCLLYADGSPIFRHILLVDDVFTSGSTLYACFVALRSVFPPSVRISIATLGFVGGG